MDRIFTAVQKAKHQGISTPLEDAVRPVPQILETSSLWATLPPIELNPKRMKKNRIAAFTRSDPAHVAFDMMRTKVLRTLRQNHWTSVAVTSPTPGCGKTVVCLNLAFSLSRQKEFRTVLADFDLRRPRVGEILGLEEEKGIEDLLGGNASIEQVFFSHGGNLAIGASHAVPNSAELLQASNTAEAVKGLKHRLKPDIIIFDLPPMLLSDDVAAFLPNVDCVIVVAAAEVSTRNEIDSCLRDLTEQTNVLGVVLNKCRYFTEKYGYY